jgi:uncharacterized protein (DUF2062 family)
LKRFSWKYITGLLSQALKQGMTPRKLAITCAFGVVISIFPIFGTTTLLCFGIAIALRLNIAIIQLVNYLFAPVQILLILPFIKIGTDLFGLNPFPYSSEQLVDLFKNDFWMLVKEAGLALFAGVGMWLLFSIPLFFVVFYLCFWIFSQWKGSRHRELKSQ